MRGWIRSGLVAWLAWAMSVPAFAGETVNHTYDALGRLVTSVSSGSINTGQTINASYDPAGNRTNYSVTGVTPTSIAISNASVTEGGNLVFTVTRSGDASTAFTVNYATAGGTATSGTDFTAASGTLSFAANQTSATITVATIDDALVESSEAMTMTLSVASGGVTISTATGTGTIIDNDAAAQLAIGNASVTEGGNLVFTVARSVNTANAVSVNYATASGTATSGTDFTAASGTLNFAANQTAATITVATIDDTLVESNENMTVTLSGASSGATITTATGTGTIVDNDVAWSSALTAGYNANCFFNGVVICYFDRGYMASLSKGTMTNVTFAGATITNLYTDNTSLLFLTMQGATTPPPNSGWSSITVPGVGTVNRASASYSTSGTISTWVWNVSTDVANGTVTIQ